MQAETIPCGRNQRQRGADRTLAQVSLTRLLEILVVYRPPSPPSVHVLAVADHADGDAKFRPILDARNSALRLTTIKHDWTALVLRVLARLDPE